MALLDIYSDSKGQGRCRSCGASITWAELTTGRKMPFDGDVVVVRTQGNILGGDRVVETVDTSITRTHFETCPDAKKWRRDR